MGADGRGSTRLSATPQRPLRWAFLLSAAGFLTVGKFSGLVQASSTLIATCLAAAALIAWVLSRLAQPQWATRYQQVALTVHDLLLAAVVTFLAGPDLGALAILVSAVPHSFDSQIRARAVAPPAATLTYLVAVACHRLAFDPPWWPIPTEAYLEALMVLGVVSLLGFRYSQVLRGVRLLRTAIAIPQHDENTSVSQGVLGEIERLQSSMRNARAAIDSALVDLLAAAKDGDELANEIGAHAVDSGTAARELTPLAADLAETVSVLHHKLQQRSAQTSEAVAEWDRIVLQAESASAHLSDWIALLQRERDRSESILRAVRDAYEQLDKTTDAAKSLVDSSRGIDSVAQQILKISRHTHVLALNAAIEAAHAGEHGRGFALVAEQVRRLAADARVAAREVAHRTSAIHDEAESVTKDLATQGSILQNLQAVTDDMRPALEQLAHGAGQIREAGEAGGAGSSTHGEYMGSVLGSLTPLLADCERCSGLAESLTGRLRNHRDEASRLQDAARAAQLLASDLRATADRLPFTQTQQNTTTADRT